MTIYQYPIAITDVQMVLMPLNAQILTVQIQRDQCCLWAMVDARNTDKEARTIEIFGNGQPMDHQERAYIGTVQQVGGALVWHVLERL